MRDCECRLCSYSNNIDSVVASLPEGKADEIKNLFYDIISSFEQDITDLGWHKSVIDGSWPRSQEIRELWMSTWRREVL